MPDIIRCPACRKETYAGLAACPHCGHQLFRQAKDGPDFEPNQPVDKSADTIFKPSANTTAPLFLIGVLAVVLIVFLHYIGTMPLLEFFASFSLFGSLALLGFSMLKLEKPRLFFNKDGLSYAGLFKSYFWRWSEVGQFSIRTRYAFYKEIPHLCAQSSSTPGPLFLSITFGTDIAIPLSAYRGIDKKSTAQQLADHLNRMRKAYG